MKEPGLGSPPTPGAHRNISPKPLHRDEGLSPLVLAGHS